MARFVRPELLAHAHAHEDHTEIPLSIFATSPFSKACWFSPPGPLPRRVTRVVGTPTKGVPQGMFLASGIFLYPRSSQQQERVALWITLGWRNASGSTRVTRTVGRMTGSTAGHATSMWRSHARYGRLLPCEGPRFRRLGARRDGVTPDDSPLWDDLSRARTIRRSLLAVFSIRRSS